MMAQWIWAHRMYPIVSVVKSGTFNRRMRRDVEDIIYKTQEKSVEGETPLVKYTARVSSLVHRSKVIPPFDVRANS